MQPTAAGWEVHVPPREPQNVGYTFVDPGSL